MVYSARLRSDFGTHHCNLSEDRTLTRPAQPTARLPALAVLSAHSVRVPVSVRLSVWHLVLPSIIECGHRKPRCVTRANRACLSLSLSLSLSLPPRPPLAATRSKVEITAKNPLAQTSLPFEASVLHRLRFVVFLPFLPSFLPSRRLFRLLGLHLHLKMSPRGRSGDRFPFLPPALFCPSRKAC